MPEPTPVVITLNDVPTLLAHLEDQVKHRGGTFVNMVITIIRICKNLVARIASLEARLERLELHIIYPPSAHEDEDGALTATASGAQDLSV